MRVTTFMGVALLAAPLYTASAAETLSLDNETARINYSLGYQIGGDFKRQAIELSAPAMMKGIEDALSGAESMMKPEEMRSTLMELKQKIVAEQKKKAEEQAKEVAEQGKKFLERTPSNPAWLRLKAGSSTRSWRRQRQVTHRDRSGDRELPRHQGRWDRVRQLIQARETHVIPVERRGQGWTRGCSSSRKGARSSSSSRPSWPMATAAPWRTRP